MNFRVSSANLLSLVSKSKGVVDARGVVALTSHVQLVAEKDSITLTCTDYDVVLRSSCPAQVIVPCTIVAPGKLLLGALKSFSGEVTGVLEASDSGRVLRLSGGGFKCSISCMDPDDYPRIEKSDFPQGFEVPVSVLRANLRLVDFCMASDSAYLKMCGVNMYIAARDDGQAGFRSTDGHRLSVVQFSVRNCTADPGLAVTVHSKGMRELFGLMDGLPGDAIVFVGVTRGEVLFRAGTGDLYVRVIDEPYPDVDSVLPLDKHSASVGVSSVLLAGAIRAVQPFVDVNRGTIDIQGSEAGLVVAATGLAGGEGSFTVDGAVVEGEFKFGLNWRYLQDVCAAVDKGALVIESRGDDYPIVIRDDACPFFVHALMPVVD